MQRSNTNQSAMSTHRKMQASTTLSRKYVKRPENEADKVVVNTKPSQQVRHFNDQQQMQGRPMAEKEQMQVAKAHPLQVAANARIKERQARLTQAQQTNKLTAKQLKDQAIQKALSEASQPMEQESKKERTKLRFGFPRIALAISCTAVIVFMIVYFVNMNMPDISLKVAAMQSGFDASYPSYVPRDYNLSGITSESGKVILNFVNHQANSTFSIVEEKSAWDSVALLNNYIRPTYDENYSIVKEQGLTIYLSDSDAAWVNGGVVYKLITESGSLTKKQIKTIATSL